MQIEEGIIGRGGLHPPEILLFLLRKTGLPKQPALTRRGYQGLPVVVPFLWWLIGY